MIHPSGVIVGGYIATYQHLIYGDSFFPADAINCLSNIYNCTKLPHNNARYLVKCFLLEVRDNTSQFVFHDNF
jgi:hypothetical protein